MNSPEITIRFGGHALVLHAHGVIYWPHEKTLVASDLHFEKSTFLAAHGSIVPPYDTHDTLQRLEELIDYYQPARLILLGDSFHDRQAWSRLDAALQARIGALATATRQCIWIEGNHDLALEMHPLSALTAGITLSGIHFAHDDSAVPRPVIIGHYHPKTQVFLGRRSASGKCFIHSEQLLIMPSFGSYTGGLNVRHAVIRNLFTQQPPRIHLSYRGHLYPLTHSAKSPVE